MQGVLPKDVILEAGRSNIRGTQFDRGLQREFTVLWPPFALEPARAYDVGQRPTDRKDWMGTDESHCFAMYDSGWSRSAVAILYTYPGCKPTQAG
jgi:hypothetical protein